jgi:asparagine synthase (glutamine-hydrolysing)
MCGVAGFLCRGQLTADELGERVSAMTATLSQRGPDADGLWLDEQAGIAIGHRRLSIIDLSNAGAQPMLSSDGRWVMSYNGELYNTAELRREVEGARRTVNWRGHSDTEVILEAVAIWGVPATIQKLNGMFAVAFWDRRDRRLWLVRDRLGIKPLLWSLLPDGTFVFASELRALMPFPNFAPRIDPQAAAAFMRHACVPAPLTIYQGVHKLAPAHILAVEQGRQPKLFCYWDLLQIAEENQRHIDGRPQSQIADDLDSLLRDAVVRQMVSDVPLGAFLSGGIDSSTVVALMQAQSNRKVHTFSIGSQNEAYNEASHANLVAQHLGTEHTELIVDSKMARAVVDRLPDIYDEPFADSSQIPTFIVSQLARRDVTVSLSGDGGDECFAGYVRHHWSNLLALYSRNVPAVLSKTFGFALRSISPAAWDTILSPVPKRLRAVHAGDKIHKLAALLPLSDLNQMYRRVIAQWPEPQTVVPDSAEPLQPWHDRNITAALRDPMSQVRFCDTMQYLPDDILTKVDRASMAVSLEVRVPLLDHRVVEYSWRLPRSALIRGNRGKQILRDVLHRYVPPALVERPKAGFAVPIGEWIRRPLAGWASELLSRPALAASGLLNSKFIEQRLVEHQTGRRDWSHGLWAVLMFQAWYRRWST